MAEMSAEIKAMLLSAGGADIDEALLRKYRSSVNVQSAAGGNGAEYIFVQSGGHRVRTAVDKSSPLKVIGDPDRGKGGVTLIKDGQALFEGILEPVIMHCPGQAHISINERCAFDCSFCPAPKMGGRVRSARETLDLITAAMEKGNLRAVSIASRASQSPKDDVKRVAEAVKLIRGRYDDVPIGVSVYPTETSSRDLYQAGATEIKYNVQTLGSEIFKRHCRGLSLVTILKSLEDAAEIFGDNRVSSNFITGLGETDECVRFGTSRLADIGVMAVLRPASPHPLRSGDIDVHRQEAGRILLLARMARQVFDEHGLRADKAETMCLSCTGCILSLHRDI